MRAVSLWLWQERLKGRWQGSPPQAFMHAWGRELLASLPGAVRRGLQPGRAPRHCPWPLPAQALAVGERVILDLPAEHVLVQRLALPLAAARDLTQVMQFELTALPLLQPTRCTTWCVARRWTPSSCG